MDRLINELDSDDYLPETMPALNVLKKSRTGSVSSDKEELKDKIEEMAIKSE